MTVKESTMPDIRTLQIAIRKEEPCALAKKLGYPSCREGKRAIDAFLKSDSLYRWLKTYAFDGTHGPRSFFKRLIPILGFEPETFEEVFEKAATRLAEFSSIPQPYIYVDTGFKRVGESILTLAMAESFRRIPVDKTLAFEEPLETVLKHVSEKIVEHYAQSEGKLVIWGKILGYVYYHYDGKRFEFDTEGRLLPEHRLKGDVSFAWTKI